MPYPNQHSCRVLDPDAPHDSAATKEIDSGVSVILYIKDGKSQPQAYRFDKDKFTAAEAKAWLKRNDVHCIGFEEATGREAGAGPPGKLTVRMLNINLQSPKFEETDDGLLIKDVKILAEGTWTDSYQQTPCHYSAEVLREYWNNWKANGYWLRHQGGAPRSIDEKVGEVRSPRYENGAVMGDLFLHLATTKSRDHVEMVKRGYADAVSAEIATVDDYDKKHKRYIAKYLEFSGVASVDRGACETCRIRNNETGEPPEVETMDKEELDKTLSAFKADILGEVGKELDKRFAGLAPAARPEEMKTLSEKLGALEGTVKALNYEERLKKLETAPASAKTLAAGREPEEPMAERPLPRISKGEIVCE